jgi:hypothetical protein
VIAGEKFSSFQGNIQEMMEKSESQEEKPYDYPFPDDVDAEFRKKCRERFKTVLTYC